MCPRQDRTGVKRKFPILIDAGILNLFYHNFEIERKNYQNTRAAFFPRVPVTCGKLFEIFCDLKCNIVLFK